MITDIDDGTIDVTCDNCSNSFVWFSSSKMNLRLMWCENCKVNRLEELEKRPKTTRQQTWLEKEVERLTKDQAQKNTRIVHLLEVQTELDEKRKQAVNRAHKLQLKLNNYERATK